MSTTEMTFEEALAGLEKSAADLMKKEITLGEAMDCFERGIGYYNKCGEILSSAKQKIIMYSKEQGDE